ncbi:MAG: HAD-IA family hydrolase [Nitrospirae bacterium]|nr:HAD-IA family hydrolase [Nitrospirota bacterium]
MINPLGHFLWQNIDTVLLDMDGTLLDKYFDDYFWEHFLPEQYSEKYKLDVNEAKKQLLSRYRKEEKTLAWTDLDFWSREFVLDIPALKEQVNHLIAVHPHVVDFLKFLRINGKQIHLVTNAHYKTLELKLRKTEIGKYFDSVVCAFDIGLPKEDAAFWPKLEKLIGFDKNRTMLVDDNEDVLISAREYGMGHIILKSRPSSREGIRSSAHFSAIADFDELMRVDDDKLLGSSL